MSIRRLFSVAGAVLATLSLVVLTGSSLPDSNDNSSAVERGRYLVNLGGCGDCHSPKAMTAQGPAEDIKRLLSGHPSAEPIETGPATLGQGGWIGACNSHQSAWAGPWGISFASNLTPDKKTGLGNWTVDQFINTMRTGKHRGYGRQILPPMPWQNLSKVTDEDLAAIFAYLQSLSPVANAVPEPLPPTK